MRHKPEHIIDIVASFYRLSRKDLEGQSRRRHVVQPRQVCMYLLRKLTGYSFEAIGYLLGCRDHTTVLHSCAVVKARLADPDDTLADEVRHLERDLRTTYPDCGYQAPERPLIPMGAHFEDDTRALRT